MRKIKILIISVGKIYGGIEKYTLDLVRNLNKEKFEIHLAVRSKGILKEHVNDLGIDKILELDLSKKKLVTSICFLKKYVKENNIEIIHCNSNNGLLVALACSKSKKIAVIHGDVWIDHARSNKIIRLFYQYLENWLIRTAGCCVTVSYSLRKILTERIGKDERIRVIYNGIQIRQYNSRPKYDAKVIKICCVGNMLASKGHIILLKALQILTTKGYTNYVCDLYGEGPEKEQLVQFVANNNIPNINFVGFDNNVRAKLYEYQICVQPSIYESFGISIIEAMNASCCIIASEIGGIPEIINDGENGLLFEVGNYEKLAEFLAECIDDRDMMKRLAVAGYDSIVNKFSIEHMIDKYEDLYETSSKNVNNV